MHKAHLALVLLATQTACSFIARGPDEYRSDTRTLLESKNPHIRSCFDAQLATDPTASGTVVVNFTVEKKTGIIKDVAVDPSTKAPEPLQQCVVTALEGLKLTPEDRRDGQATFTWEFRAPTAG